MKISGKYKKDAFITRIATNISSIDETEWKKVFPDTLEGYGLFKTLNESHSGQFTFFYILVYSKKSLVGIAPCFLIDYALDTTISGPVRRISNFIKKINPSIFNLRAFVCGSPMGEGRIGIASDTDKVLKLIIRKMEQIAHKKRARAIAFKDFGGSFTAILDKLCSDGFSKFNTLPATKLAMRFSDFDDYLNSLSHKTRYDLRRKFRKVDGSIKIDREIVTQPDEETYKQIYRLYNQVVEKHEMGLENTSIDFFKGISRNLPDNVKYFLWRVDGKLVMFSLCLVSKDLVIGYYMGMDYAVAYDYHLYFIKLRDILNWCISHNIKSYEMGYTGYETKRRLGFKMNHQYLYVKLHNPVLRPAFNFICQFLKLENFDKELKKVLPKSVKK